MKYLASIIVALLLLAAALPVSAHTKNLYNPNNPELQPIEDCTGPLGAAQVAVSGFDLAITYQDGQDAQWKSEEADARNSLKEVASDLRLSPCHQSGMLAAIKAYVLTAKAYDHYLLGGYDAGLMETANQSLEQCTTHPKNYGTQIGGDCSAQLKKNIAHQTSWEQQSP